jgi:cytochrome b subunit of formate dehydrogenase
LAAANAAVAADCADCHDQSQKLAKSAHASVACATCHEKHDQYPHPAGVPKPVCTGCHTTQAEDYANSAHGQAARAGNAGAPDCAMCHGNAHELRPPRSHEFRTTTPDTCGMCHTKVVEEYRSSVHGQALARGVIQAPICTDCHGEHRIVKHSDTSSPVHGAHIRETCGRCHGDLRLTRKFGLPQDRMVSFDASFHGLAAKAGAQTVANCASCHGVHNILPASDSKSMVNTANLPQTCGQCHPGAGKRFAIGPVHITEGAGEPKAIKWVRGFYLFLIPTTIGLMLLHNLGDWVRKLIRIRARGVARLPFHGELRMLPFERVEHGVLALSFFVLAWSGFALKYPDQIWAYPLLPARSMVHRIAAVVFVAVAVAHAASLLFSRKLRHHWTELLPRKQDIREASTAFTYNMGIGSSPPPRSAHSYIEKAEYWAVVWGAIVMIATGILLWANNIAMALLPKTWLDVSTAIHFYEAVLATLAILVWHLYSAIFDPDVYPLDTAFLTGRSVKIPETETHDSK